MDQSEHDGVATALRRPNKGPANAVIRTVTMDEAESAFNDPAGEAPAMPGANKIGGPGGRGSVAGIRTGSREAGGGLDVRAAQNLADRRARQAGAGRPAPAATVVPPARLPAQPPSQAPLEPWELPPQTTQEAPAAAVPKRDYYPDHSQTDRLAVAQMDALAILGRLPEGFELFVGGNGLGPEGVALVMGLGFLIGKGYAAYRGGDHYRLTEAGREAYRRGEHGHA